MNIPIRHPGSCAAAIRDPDYFKIRWIPHKSPVKKLSILRDDGAGITQQLFATHHGLLFYPWSWLWKE